MKRMKSNFDLNVILDEKSEILTYLCYNPFHLELHRRLRSLDELIRQHNKDNEITHFLDCPVCKKGQLFNGRCQRCLFYKTPEHAPKNDFTMDVLPPDQEGVRLRGKKYVPGNHTNIDMETGEILPVVVEYV